MKNWDIHLASLVVMAQTVVTVFGPRFPFECGLNLGSVPPSFLARPVRCVRLRVGCRRQRAPSGEGVELTKHADSRTARHHFRVRFLHSLSRWHVRSVFYHPGAPRRIFYLLHAGGITWWAEGSVCTADATLSPNVILNRRWPSRPMRIPGTKARPPRSSRRPFTCLLQFLVCKLRRVSQISRKVKVVGLWYVIELGTRTLDPMHRAALFPEENTGPCEVGMGWGRDGSRRNPR